MTPLTLRRKASAKGPPANSGYSSADQTPAVLSIISRYRVQSDSVGEIYATKRGELRFITSNDSAQWIKGAAKKD